MKLTKAFKFFALSIVAGAGLHAVAGDLQESMAKVKSELVDLDISSREVMGSLFEVNSKMKNMTRRKGILNNKLLWIDSKAKTLSKETVALESILQEQRSQLSARLRAIYKIGDENMVRIIFSSASSKDLDEVMKYLKIISQADFKLIRSYAQNLDKLNDKKKKLENEVRKLITAKTNLTKQEQQLTAEQQQKSIILSKLKEDREKTLKQISRIRNLAQRYELESLFDLSFFEQKGKIKSPIKSKIISDFGISEDRKFGYQIKNKGLRFSARTGEIVSAIHKGRVVFQGYIDGNGKIMILDHGDHYYSVYGMLESFNVSEGEVVEKDQAIARSSQQLYFELRHFSEAIDPSEWLIKTKSGDAS